MSKENQGDTASHYRAVKVKPRDLHTWTDEFQFREQHYDRNHVQELIGAIRRGDDLDRMTAWRNPDDGLLYIIAGHHRLRAYRATKRTKAIWVNVYEGSLHGARLRALASNSKTKLPMSTKERQDAAWKLVCYWHEETGYEYSIRATAQSAGVSTSQVSNMRTVRNALEESGKVIPTSWMKALNERRGREFDEMEPDEQEERTEAQAAELDKKVGSALTQAAQKAPVAVARVLARRFGPRSHVIAEFMATASLELDELDELDEEEAFEFMATASVKLDECPF